MESIEYLAKNLPSGSIVTAIRRNGKTATTQHHITLLAVVGGKIDDLTWHVANATGMRLVEPKGSGYRAVVFQGGGMSPTFGAVYNLQRAIALHLEDSDYRLASQEI